MRRFLCTAVSFPEIIWRSSQSCLWRRRFRSRSMTDHWLSSKALQQEQLQQPSPIHTEQTKYVRDFILTRRVLDLVWTQYTCISCSIQNDWYNCVYFLKVINPYRLINHTFAVSLGCVRSEHILCALVPGGGAAAAARTAQRMKSRSSCSPAQTWDNRALTLCRTHSVSPYTIHRLD